MHPYYRAVQRNPNYNHFVGLVVKLEGSPMAVMLGATSEHEERVEFNFCGGHARLELPDDRVFSLGDFVTQAMSQ